MDSRRKKYNWGENPGGFFQWDALSPLIFVLAMMPLNHILKKYSDEHKLHKSQENINHLIYMDDIKLFTKNEKKQEILTQAVRIYSEDVGMEFGIEKCALLIMKSGKRHIMEGIKLSNQEKVKTLGEKENYKCSGILEVDIIKHAEMKEKIKAKQK